MKNEDGEEIVEPGDYELEGGRNLRVYLTEDADETIHMWACTHCQEVDGTFNAILSNVLDGAMSVSQDPDGEFLLSITEAGKDRVRNMIGDITKGDSDD